VKVWIIVGYVDYESSDILGVFSTKELAEKAMPVGDGMNGYVDIRYYDGIYIEEYGVDIGLSSR
jgi:hypothetical protein